ncbi:MAG TPA: POTRA domain-containing protein [Chitinophagaceae bacterium]|jgi:outer membrane protein assembly factor BamA|nr:POTRA domain-containing protein [Chitinophagaceae bacterium]
MTKLKQPISLVFFLFAYILLSLCADAQEKYELNIKAIDKDSAFLINTIGLQNSFSSRATCIEYVNKLPSILQSKGYVTASLDSLQYDTMSARIVLFLGEAYHWVQLNTDHVNTSILNAVGWRQIFFSNKPMDFNQIQTWQEKILDYLENNGHPFAKIYLDSLQLSDDKVYALLKIDEGPLYKIDSVRVYGDVKISNKFLQRYLDVADGSIYNRQKLQNISKKLLELTYVEEEKPSNISLLATGSVLNLYLRPRRSSQINLLFGFLPNNDQFSNKKLLITGEGNLNLKNALGAGETIGVSYQKLQVRSQRLNLFYQHPYLFNSPIGIDFAFDMYRRDSIYLNVNLQLGGSYIFSSTQSGKLYLQHFLTIANGINTNYVLQNHSLPDEADVSSFNVGIDYTINTTDYNRNPRKGKEFTISTTVGTKKIKKNNQVIELEDPNDPSFNFEKLYDTIKLKTYQFRIKTVAIKYFPLGKQGTIKTAINAGIFQSANIFKNELFQIGGFRLLRGFDEESQYLSQYAIGVLEYHYLISQNSYFYALIDGGWGRNNSQNTDVNHTYLSTGLGLAFETKIGIFNLAWAIGRRDDIPFNLRQSKIHFGFINYF